MNQTLTLSIPTPCSQHRSAFTPVEGGGFCSSCSKVVVDFTKMTDAQMIEYLQKVKGETCGTFRADQLKTFSLHPPLKVQTGFNVFKAGLIGLLLFALSRPSQAQVDVRKSGTELAPATLTANDTTGIIFKGIVTSADDQSVMPGVNVVIKGTPIGTVTDASGRFQLPEKVRKGDVLVFSFIGLVTKEYKVDGRKDAGLEVPMQLCMDYDITGEVNVEGLYSEKENRSFWSRVKEWF